MKSISLTNCELETQASVLDYSDLFVKLFYQDIQQYFLCRKMHDHLLNFIVAIINHGDISISTI